MAETLSLEPLADKLTAFGCDVAEINGHDHEQLVLELSKRHEYKPRAIIARTIKGKGISFMENRVEWHYKNPTDDQLEIALKELESLK